MRVEQRDNDWIRTWAFKIDESKAKKEGFDKTEITGSLNADPYYPGCPHCGANTIVVCGTCRKVCCLNYGDTSAHCYWCGTQMSITYGEAKPLRVSSGGDF